MSKRETCTGIAASWCPNCGECTCQWALPDGGVGNRNDPNCPLHSRESQHPLAPCLMCGPDGCPIHRDQQPALFGGQP